MTYRELWSRLTAVYDENEAKAVTDYVLSERFGLSKADALCGLEGRLDAGGVAELNRLFLRLADAEPVQYVLGRAEFCRRWFNVRPGVLIPRPETEELCALITEDSKETASPDVLDIGTGSGCIAVTLALDMPESHVSAWDVSEDALAIARENAALMDARVAFECRDMLRTEPQSERWDIIVSNPPYICNKEKAAMERNVLDYEPHGALFVPDDDPLLFYRTIARYAARTLRHGGRLYFEINPAYAGETEAMMCNTGFSEVSIIEDIYGKKRMARGVNSRS